MTFTIEPMVNVGKFDVKVLNDGWTAVTRCLYQHNLSIIGITEDLMKFLQIC